jgi:hypothetical protein
MTKQDATTTILNHLSFLTRDSEMKIPPIMFCLNTDNQNSLSAKIMDGLSDVMFIIFKNLRIGVFIPVVDIYCLNFRLPMLGIRIG